MEEEMRRCRLESCGTPFLARVHNQTFCNRECCRVFTNARILAQYHAKKNKVMTGRTCFEKDCGTLLSRYNDGDYCSVHEAKRLNEKLIGWGWKISDDGEVIR